MPPDINETKLQVDKNKLNEGTELQIHSFLDAE